MADMERRIGIDAGLPLRASPLKQRIAAVWFDVPD
jgi:hypothetical protein